jgi:hypothetical protein
MKKYFDSFFEKICILLFIRIFQNIFTAEFGGTSCGIGAAHVIWATPLLVLRTLLALPAAGKCALVGLRRY